MPNGSNNAWPTTKHAQLSMRIIKSNEFATSQSWRILAFMVALGILLLGTVSCVPAKIKKQFDEQKLNMPKGGEANNIYYVHHEGFLSFLPDWYRMYSMASGVENPEIECSKKKSYYFSTQNLKISVVNCSSADSRQIIRLVNLLQLTVRHVQTRFHEDFHVSYANFKLFGPKDGYYDHRTHVVHPNHLTFGMTLSYDPNNSSVSERHIVRTTAHELFHMARYILGSNKDGNRVLRLSEETKASFFGLCVDRDVFGSLEKGAFDKGELFAPHWVKGIQISHASADGSIRANEILTKIAGRGDRLSTKAQISRFNHYCRKIVN